MNQKQKRSRSQNWDEEEKLLFRSVLKKYAHIIENKSLDTNSNNKKTEAWDEIHKKFNELNSRHRQLSQLKIQWKSMKINVRKSYSTVRNDCNKTSGGARPATPDDSVLEIKDLLDPAETLRDHNIYDSDGIFQPIPSTSTSERTTSEASITNQEGNSREMITLQESKPIAYVVKALDTCTKFDNINHEYQQTADICKETLDVDAQAEYTPLVICQDNVATPIQKNLSTSTAKIRDDDDYVSSLLRHIKIFKEEEHRRKMEMAEEEHNIKMAIHEEKLRSAIIEREILEKKMRIFQ